MLSLTNTKPSESLQRTDGWFKDREGKFTASKISRLLGKESLSKTKQSIDNYAFEKAVESIYGREEDSYISEDMKRGIVLEPMAFELLRNIKAFDFLETTECNFYPYGKHAGASPDGRVSNNSNVEIKCLRRNKFFKIVANGYDEIDSSYIAQMQMQMLCTDTERTYFFNYFLDKGIEYWHEIEVQRDEEMIDLIKDRIKVATEIKLNYIQKINANRQF